MNSYLIGVIHTHWRTSFLSHRALVMLAVIAALVATPAPAQAIVSQTPTSTPTFNGTVWATAYSGDTIYVGGDFTAALVGGRLVPRARLAAINASSGALLDWAPQADGQVRAIAVLDRSVYLGGRFSTIDGIRRDSLARVDAHSGDLRAGFQHTVTGQPYALAVGSGRLFVGGSITEVDGQRRSRLAAFGLDSGNLDRNWRPKADDQVESLLATSGRVYVGGRFHKINNADGTRRLAAVTTTSGKVISGFKANTDFITYGIAAAGSRVYAVHGGQGGRLISYDPDGDKRWTLTMDGDPRSVAFLAGTVYVGGHFDNICRTARTADQGRCIDGNIPRVKLAAVDDDGRVRSWRANGNGVIGVLTLASSPRLGKLAAGGAFTTVNGATQKRFAQFG